LPLFRDDEELRLVLVVRGALGRQPWPEPRRVQCVELEDGYLLWGLTQRLLEPLLPKLLNDEFPP